MTRRHFLALRQWLRLFDAFNSTVAVHCVAVPDDPQCG
jgi:hypothetical protein